MLRDKAKLGIDQPGNPGGTMLANLAVEVNAKLGGVDRKLFGSGSNMLPVVGGKPFMVVGVDVTMPVSNNKMVPTIGGVAASMDK